MVALGGGGFLMSEVSVLQGPRGVRLLLRHCLGGGPFGPLGYFGCMHGGRLGSNKGLSLSSFNARSTTMHGLLANEDTHRIRVLQ
jgi:hypothetical protein